MKRQRRSKRRSDEDEAKKSGPEQVLMRRFLEKCVREGKIKPWQPAEIAAFFRDMKLKDKEDPKVYEETLKKY